jgi:hypothetical protein
MSAPLVFLHIPHTAGTPLKRYLKHNKLEVDCVHNAEEMQTVSESTKGYFVLREPFQRFVAEFMHYSKRLDHRGEVNHLKEEDFIGLDFQNPYQYAELEVNKNVMCKFLARSTDFSIPFTGSVNDVHQNSVFDKYQNPMQFTTLEGEIGAADLATKIIQFEENMIRSEARRSKLLNDTALQAHHQALNAKDYELYGTLTAPP